MSYDKAYKVLAKQEGISNSKAKDLIDKGLVKADGKKVLIARGEISSEVIFTIKKLDSIKVIFQDNDILALNKPAFLTSDDLIKKFPNYILLNRLDKETSGVILFAKNEDFQQKAINEFKANRVYKEYIAIVDGKVIEEQIVDTAILTVRNNSNAKSKISAKKGKPATTRIYPMFVEGNKSKIKITIDTGRTHQIRVHLNSIAMPIIGDSVYGKVVSNVARVLLHSRKTKIFDYTFEAPEPREFFVFGFK